MHAFTRTALGAATPRWSPDGTKIVYQGYAGAGYGPTDRQPVRLGRVERTGQTNHRPEARIAERLQRPRFPGSDLLAPTALRCCSRCRRVSLPAGAGLDRDGTSGPFPRPAEQPTLVAQNAFGPDVTSAGDKLTYSAVRLVDGGRGVRRAVRGRCERQQPTQARRRRHPAAALVPRWDARSPTRTSNATGRSSWMSRAGETRQILDAPEWPEWVNEDTIIVDRSG